MGTETAELPSLGRLCIAKEVLGAMCRVVAESAHDLALRVIFKLAFQLSAADANATKGLFFMSLHKAESAMKKLFVFFQEKVSNGNPKLWEYSGKCWAQVLAVGSNLVQFACSVLFIQKSRKREATELKG